MRKSRKKPRTNIELMGTIRREWTINPVTRVQEDDTKNKKKIREEGKRMAREGEE